MELVVEVVEGSNGVVVSFGPVEDVVDEVVVQVDLLLELTDHLVVVCAQVVLSHVILLQPGQEVTQLLETQLV